jgi:hypothetical protein
MLRLAILFWGLTIASAFAQTNPNGLLMRATLGSSCPSNAVLSSQYYVQQCIGQGSVIGTTTSDNGIVLRQGYLQPNVKQDGTAKNLELSLVISPNPFNETITITFYEAITTGIAVKIFDSLGKFILEQQYKASQTLDLTLSNLSNAAYFIQVSANQKTTVKKLLKGNQ